MTELKDPEPLTEELQLESAVRSPEGEESQVEDTVVESFATATEVQIEIPYSPDAIVESAKQARCLTEQELKRRKKSTRFNYWGVLVLGLFMMLLSTVLAHLSGAEFVIEGMSAETLSALGLFSSLTASSGLIIALVGGRSIYQLSERNFHFPQHENLEHALLIHEKASIPVHLELAMRTYIDTLKSSRDEATRLLAAFAFVEAANIVPSYEKRVELLLAFLHLARSTPEVAVVWDRASFLATESFTSVCMDSEWRANGRLEEVIKSFGSAMSLCIAGDYLSSRELSRLFSKLAYVLDSDQLELRHAFLLQAVSILGGQRRSSDLLADTEMLLSKNLAEMDFKQFHPRILQVIKECPLSKEAHGILRSILSQRLLESEGSQQRVLKELLLQLDLSEPV